MSLRNRELVFLIPALILTTLGFALVYTQKSSALTLVFAHLRGHLPGAFPRRSRRPPVPGAATPTPISCPITALLSTLGILVIYRINEKLALKQAMWLVVGLVAFLLVLVFVRDLNILRDYRFLIGIAGLLLPALHGRVRPRDQRGQALGGHRSDRTSSPGNSARSCWSIFFAAYLVDIREVLTVSTRRILGVPLPPFRYLAPLLTIWALSMALMIFMKDLGTSLLFFGALLALLYVATGRFFYVVVGVVLFFAGRHACSTTSFPTCRLGWTSGSIPGRTRPARATRSCSRFSRSPPGGLFGRGLGQGYLMLQSGHTIIPGAGDRLHLLRHRGGAGAGGRRRHHPALHDLHLPGLPHRGAGPGRLPAAARHRAHQHLRAAGLPHHGRGDQAHPAHRHHAAVRQLRGSSIVANFVLLALLLRTSDTVAAAGDRSARRAPPRMRAPSAGAEAA